MAIDWEAMSDEEFHAEVNAANAEQRRRTVLNTAPARVDAITSEVLIAEGIKPGDPWRQPIGAHDAYPRGSVVTHDGSRWESGMSGNVWEPGVSGWRMLGEPGVPLPWVQPTGAYDAYRMADKVTHNSQVWVSTVNDNVWEPGVYGWIVDVPSEPALYPAWMQPLGAEDAYPLGAEVSHNGAFWRSTIAENTWEPGVHGWDEFNVSDLEPDVEPYPAWVQPIGSESAYPLGAEVSHNEALWRSNVADNVWEPGVHGWDEFSQPRAGGES